MLTLVVLGAAIGLILALTGAGGGILAVPLLILGVGMTAAQAAPVGLLAVAMAAALGALLGLRAGIVRYRAALLMAGAGMLVTPCGLWLAQRANARWLALVFGLVLMAVALRMLRRRTAAATAAPVCLRHDATGRFIWTSPCARALAGTGMLGGLLSGLLGVGGGFVLVPALRRSTDLAPDAIVATSLAVIALVSTVTVAASAAQGRVDWPLALPFAGAALAGMLGGRRLAARLAGPRLQQAFAWLSIGVGVVLVIRAARSIVA